MFPVIILTNFYMPCRSYEINSMLDAALRESVQIRSFFGSVFSGLKLY